MPSTKKLGFTLLIAILGLIAFSLRSKLTVNSDTEPLSPAQLQSISEKENLKQHTSKENEISNHDSSIPKATNPTATEQTAKEKREVLKLSYGNFESFVNRCFNGETCQLQDDPMQMYKAYKAAGNLKACDQLLSFMRSQLRNPDFKNQYKDILHNMIKDFYLPNEIQFQEAAYFNYLGEYKKSLDLYLDLEKKRETNPDLRKAPALNIANTYYSLDLFREALPYYQLALKELQSDIDKFQQQREMITFTENRIAEIKRKLNMAS